MAGSFTNYGELLIADAIFSGQALPATLYLGLFTAVPTETTAGTECAGGSYARVSVACSLANFPSANPKVNANAVTFPQASAGWGTVAGYAWFSAASGGTPIAWATLDTPKDAIAGDTFSFAPGALSCLFD
jgi:hypothetical protein